jgi:hypothetical protein
MQMRFRTIIDCCEMYVLTFLTIDKVYAHQYSGFQGTLSKKSLKGFSEESEQRPGALFWCSVKIAHSSEIKTYF